MSDVLEAVATAIHDVEVEETCISWGPPNGWELWEKHAIAAIQAIRDCNHDGMVKAFVEEVVRQASDGGYNFWCSADASDFWEVDGKIKIDGEIDVRLIIAAVLAELGKPTPPSSSKQPS